MSFLKPTLDAFNRTAMPLSVLALAVLFLAQLALSRADSVVVFNEIQYHPVLPTEAEWIELHNQMSYDIDLSKWTLTGGIGFDFPAGTVIAAGGYLLISGDPANLGIAGALGPWSGSLSNSGERLRLRNNSKRLMNEIEFSDSGIWPIGADGSGATLAKFDEEKASDLAANWRASAQLGGTPGAENFPSGTTVGVPTVIVPINATWRYDESGVGHATGWAGSAHPAWPAGAGLIGFETSPGDLPEVIGNPLADPSGNSFVTYYFESDFDLSASQFAQIDSLTLRHVIDDGAIFYLNGVEVGARFNMPVGVVNSSTLANGGVSNAAYQGPLSLPTGPLVVGTNRLSVEVHQQNSGSSDIIFGAELSIAETIPPASSQSAPLVISEIAGTGDVVFQIEISNTSTVDFDAAGYVLQLRGAVDASYTIPASSMIPANGFHVIGEAELGFRPGNDDRLFLISSSGFLIHSARADDLPRAYSQSHGSKMLVPDVVTFGSPNSFAINSDIVINEIMYNFRDDPGTQGTGPTIDTVPLIGIGDTWRYNESGADLGAGWQTTAHLAGAGGWFSGPALLGSETSPAAMPEPLRTVFAPSAENSIITYYFEKEFTLTSNQLANLSSLKLEHVVDDGAVFYINGTEVKRFNLPTGAVTAVTLASPGVPNAIYKGPFELPTASLVVGSNRLSVEVHQEYGGSSDIIFGAKLSALTETVPGSDPQPIIERDEEWIELFNKGSSTVDLGGWSIDGGIDFLFPVGTSIASGGYLVVAKDAAALVTKYPGIAGQIVGNFGGQLGNSSDFIRLEDAVDNPVDEVQYFDGGRWPDLADKGGSSLELRDPDADNNNPQAWAASDETGKSAWQTVTYRDNGAQSYGLTIWNEFRLGMLGDGELLIDDVSVVRDPDGAAQQMIQNGNFTSGGSKWRFLGNHRHTAVISEPGNAGNMVLHLISKGATDTRHNHLETTFLNNTTMMSGQTYEISFRARWLSGSNAINSRCYYQRAALTTQLDRPENCGTPDAANSSVETNIGPTFRGLRHDPPVPAANEAIEVTVDVEDPDGLGEFALKVRIDEGSTLSYPLTIGADGHGYGSIPGQAAGTVIQFWIEGLDLLGGQSFAPASGADSRALIQVDDGQGSNLDIAEVRLVMLDSDLDFMLTDLNLMSNERLGGTAIHDRREIFYDAAVRLRGSGAGRARDGASFRGFNIGLPADQKFRGVHDSLSIDRSARTPAARQQHEIYVKHMFNHAGIPCMYDELIYLVGPSSDYTGTSQMLMAGYGDLFAETQFDNGGNGTVFNLDITYDPSSSIGGVEGLKPPVPFTHIGTDTRNLGDSEEDYRTSFEIRTGRSRDDFSGLINFCKIMDLPTAQLVDQIESSMDVDRWCRYTAMVLLCGIGDTFVSGGLPHNIRIFVPQDGRGVTPLPWDMDFVFSSGTSASMLPGAPNLSKVIAIPKYRRIYWGHVQDLVNTTFNSSYMTPWLAHYGGVVNQPFGGGASYITSRGNYALSQLPANVPFSVTTNGGNNYSVATTFTMIEGKGWINIREFRLAGSGEALSAEWVDGDSWRVTVPLLRGENAIVLEAYDFQGNLINTHSLTVTSTVTTPTPSEFLRITEIHYNPAPPATVAELLVSSNRDDFEFIELQNIGSEPLDVGGVRFIEGIDFTFANGTTIPAGGYIVLAHSLPAFVARYGEGIPVAGEYASSNLSNSGESLRLRDAFGNIIHHFTFGDGTWYPATDGGGYSLHIKDAAAVDPASWGTAEAWTISVNIHGNPGAPNTSVGPSYQSWLELHFSEIERNDPSISGLGIDLNNDGLTNLLKYAFGLDPRAWPPLSAMPMAEAVGGQFQFSFRRQKDVSDLEYIPQSSTDLVQWETLTIQIGDAIDNGDGTETITFQSNGPSTQKFGRVRVSFSQP